MRGKAVWTVVAAAAGICVAVWFLNRPLYKQTHTKEIPEEPVSSFQKLEDEGKNLGHSAPLDIMEAVQRDEGRRKKHASGERKISDVEGKNINQGWQSVKTDNGKGVRYYETENSYAVGWRQIGPAGNQDWYYFDEQTGFMRTGAAVDGAVLSAEGYATAIAAGCFSSIIAAEESGHCKEVLMIDDIEADRTLNIDKLFMCVTEKGETYSLCAAKNVILDALIQIDKEGEFRTGSGLFLDAAGVCKNAVSVQDSGKFSCFGGAGDFSSGGINTAVACRSRDAQIFIGKGAFITGAGTGIYSKGETVISGGNICQNGKSDALPEVFGGYRLNILSTASGNGIKALDLSSQISARQGHGIEQAAGTLYMSGGTVWDNGVFGTDTQTGSLGGGVLLSGSASMEMSGGVIAANRACVGGGIYVSENCKLTVTGGRIGGLNQYYKNRKENDSLCGNYAKESNVALHRGLYRGGEGGGIYSLGTVVLNGTDEISINCNSSRGGGGGGGINAASGVLKIEGSVSISGNRAYSSKAVKNSELYGGGDSNAEGGGIRLGRETGNMYSQCWIFSAKGKNVRISNNMASGDGGGIYVSSGKKNLLNVRGGLSVNSNRCGTGGGGGIKSLGGRLELSEIVISDNIVDGASKGGGLLSAGYLLIQNSTVSGNSSGKSGGGICFYDSSVGTSGRGTVKNCQIYGNSAVVSGDGIMNESSEGTVYLIHTSVYENRGKKDGIHCAKGSNLNIQGGTIYGNARYGINNAGSLLLSGEIWIGYQTMESESTVVSHKNDDGGIFNSGTGTVNSSSDIRIFAGNQYGLYNSGTFKAEAWKGKIPIFIDGQDTVNGAYNSGTLIWGGRITGGKYGIFSDAGGSVHLREEGIVEDAREGIHVKNEGALSASGTVRQCNGYGIYAESNSSIAVSGKFSCGKECPVFLEPECVIEVDGELSGKSVPAAVIDTKKGADRMPGRILVRVLVPGMDGKDILEGPGGPRFQTAFSVLDNGGRAAVRTGDKIPLEYSEEIDENDIILSQKFLIHYNSGIDQIQGASESDIEVRQKDTDKYWMEDAVLNLEGPVVIKDNLKNTGWKFLYWDGSNHTVYTGFQAVYKTNADLTLTARWHQEIRSSLHGYLYNYSFWLRQGGNENKENRVYTHFITGDTGEIIFEYQHLSRVLLIWPDSGTSQSLKNYDGDGTYVKDQSRNTEAVIEKRSGYFRFRVPVDTPAGTYEVLLRGCTPDGTYIDCPLVLYVDDGSITSTFRTRIR